MKDIRFAKFLVFVNGGVPLVLLIWDACRHRLGANPVNFAILTTGMLTLVFLMLTLLVTPIRKITGWNWLIFSRRTFGLYAFFYGCAHFLIFFALDRSFSVSDTLSEMVKRKYLVVGSLGLLLMVPLAVTSTNAAIKRLGAPRWRTLHRLVYVTAIAGVIHYYMQVKADVRQPLAFAGVLGVLLGYRVIGAWRGRAPAAETPVKSKMWSGPLRVAKVTPETPDVRTFRLVAPEGEVLAFGHQPGQYLALSLMIAGKKVIRTYTIASSAAQSRYCEVTIKREAQGLASRFIHDTVRENDVLQVSAPAGRFTFTGAEASSIVLIAGGVGITPLMAIARNLTDKNWPGEIYFIYSARTAQDIIFRQELEDLSKRFPKLHLVVTLTNSKDAGWTGRTGRITGELLTQTVPKLAACPVFICGPTAMMEPMQTLLRSLGVPEEKIRTEAFVAAKREPAVAIATAPAEVKEGAPKITFAQSGKAAALSPEKSLLETAEACGLNIDYECRSGICGRCKTRLLSGSVTMEVQDALSDRDKAENLILMCQAKATRDVTVEA